MCNQKTNEQKQYEQKVRNKMPKSKTLLQCFRSFWVGGVICCIGQLVSDITKILFHFPEDMQSSFTSIIMVFLGMLLTGIGVYDKIGNYAGAGSIVPITGFANSIVSPAMEYKREGYILGVGAKLFSIAGPVLVFGISASVAIGLIYLIFGF